MTSFKDTCCIEILPSFEKPQGGKIFLVVRPEVRIYHIFKLFLEI